MRNPTQEKWQTARMDQQEAARTTTLSKKLVETSKVRVPTFPTSSFNGLNVPREPGGSADGRCIHSSCQAARIFSQNNENFNRSAAPVKIMYYHNKSWVKFSDDVVNTLRTGFLQRRPIIQTSIAGESYVFDLMRMLQTDCSTGYCRSISWFDENGKCFFPIGFFRDEEFREGVDDCCSYDKNNCNPKIEIEVKIDRASPKRKLEEEPEVNSTYNPIGRDVIKRQRVGEGGSSKFSNAKLLRETERAYSFVKNHFLNRMRVDDGVEVISIHQCIWESPLGKARLEVARKQIEIIRARRGTGSTVYAWYGASPKVIESVVAHGFGLPSKIPPTDVHGIGIYLSSLELPHLSANLAYADDNGVKHIIMCRVVLGNVEKVEAGSHQCLPSSADFDIGSDDPENPKWYVVWSTSANMHILPEFVVSFKLTANMQGQRPPVGVIPSFFEQLILKLQSSLPAAKFQEIEKLCSEFKGGKLVKSTVLSQIRMIAGDEVFRSAIH